MKEIKGDIFEQHYADAICVTTNGIVKANGELTMGKGLALEFKERYPSLALTLGRAVEKYGNIVLVNKGWEMTSSNWDDTPGYHIVTFPTKNHWRDKASLSLIKRSAEQLVIATDRMGWKKVVLSRPGCGLGGLQWPQVKAVLEPILDDRFYIITP